MPSPAMTVDPVERPTNTAPASAMRVSRGVCGQVYACATPVDASATLTTKAARISPRGLTSDLDQECVALPAARPDRGQAESAARAPQLVYERGSDPAA